MKVEPAHTANLSNLTRAVVSKTGVLLIRGSRDAYVLSPREAENLAELVLALKGSVRETTDAGRSRSV